MNIEKPTIARIMKYVILLLIIGFVVMLMLYMSGSNKPFEDVEASLEKKISQEGMSRQDDPVFKRNLGLNAADYSGVMYFSSGESMSAEEILLVKVKNDDQIQEVTHAIEERITSRKNDFEGYAPEQAKMLDDAVQNVRGRYIFYAVSPNAEKYLDVFRDSL